MKLLRKYMVDCLERTAKNNMRVRVIGDKTGLSEDIQKSIADVEEASAGNTGLNFTIAINYGSRDEMIRAMKKMMAKTSATEEPSTRPMEAEQFAKALTKDSPLKKPPV